MIKKYSLSLLLLLFSIMIQAASIETQKRDIGSFTKIYSSSSVDVIVEQSGQYAVEVKAPEKYMENIITEIKDGELHIYIRGSVMYSGDIIVYVQVKDLTSVSLSGSGDFKAEGTLIAPNFSFRVSGSGDFVAELNSKVVDGSLSGSGDAKISGITESLEIRQSGSGDMLASGLHLLSAKLRMSGSGDTKFSGSSDFFELTQAASGDFSGRDFEVETAIIKKSSSGDAQIRIEKSLDISISGSGDLYYSGKPEFKRMSITGSGDIVKIK